MWHLRKAISMAGVFCGILLAAADSRAADINLQVGDVAPDFRGLDDQGQMWNSRDHIGQKILVVYFYPSDFSFCCTRQAERYRDHQCEFANLDTEVIGISGDAVEAHRLFKNDQGLNFSLLSDGTGDVARKFGVPLRDGGKAMIVNAGGRAVTVRRNVTTARWTFIIGKDGRVLYRETEVSPVKDSQEVLEFLHKM